MFWMTNSVDFLQRICPLPGSKGLTVSRVLFWGCANQLGNICCPSGKVTGVTVSGLDVHSDPPSSLSCCTPSALWGLQALQAQSPQSNYILIEACFNLYGAMGWAAPAVCLSVCLPASQRRARLGPIDSDKPNSDWWLVCGGIRSARLLFEQLIDLLVLASGRVSLNLISEFISGRCERTEMMEGPELWVKDWGWRQSKTAI